MKHYIKPQIALIVSDLENTLLAGSPQLNDKYISSNKDLAPQFNFIFDDEDEDEE